MKYHPINLELFRCEKCDLKPETYYDIIFKTGRSFCLSCFKEQWSDYIEAIESHLRQKFLFKDKELQLKKEWESQK